MKIFFLLLLFCELIFGEVNIAIPKLKSSDSENTTKTVTEAVTKAIKSKSNYKVMDFELIEILSQSQNISTNCQDDECFKNIGDALGTDYVLFGSFTSTETNSTLSLSLYNTSLSKIENQGNFSYKSKITNIDANTIKNDVLSLFDKKETKTAVAPPQPLEKEASSITLITISNPTLSVKTNTTTKIDYQVVPSKFQNDVTITSDNRYAVEIVNDSIKSGSIGKAIVTIKSKTDSTIFAKINVDVVFYDNNQSSSNNDLANIKEEATILSVNNEKKDDKQPSNASNSKRGKISIIPQVMLISQYNGPTAGGGLLVGYNIKEKHFISAEADYGYMPEFFYNQNTSTGFGISYLYKGILSFNKVDINIGASLGYWFFKNDKASDHFNNEPKIIIENRFLYFGGPKLGINIMKHVVFENIALIGLEKSHEGTDENFMGNHDFKGIAVAVKTSLGYKFDL